MRFGEAGMVGLVGRGSVWLGTVGHGRDWQARSGKSRLSVVWWSMAAYGRRGKERLVRVLCGSVGLGRLTNKEVI